MSMSNPKDGGRPPPDDTETSTEAETTSQDNPDGVITDKGSSWQTDTAIKQSEAPAKRL